MSDLAEVYEEEKWTYKDYKNWELKPGERYELIDGIAYAMSAPNTAHQRIVSILNGEFYQFLKGKKCQVIPSPFDVRLFYEEDESDDTVVQPDVVVICDPEKLGKEGCRGAPTLVIEVLSPSNTAIEMYRKRDLYASAEVPEFWIVNPDKKLIEIYRLNGDHYETTAVLRMGDTVQSALFPGLAISLETIFASI